MNPNRDKSAHPGDALRFHVDGHPIMGCPIDQQTRCKHYHSPLDIIAIKFKCCNEYFPCFECHEETAGHRAEVWGKKEFDRKAVLCGACGHEMTISEYFSSKDKCPVCKAQFNPNCSKHYHLYFDR